MGLGFRIRRFMKKACCCHAATMLDNIRLCRMLLHAKYPELSDRIRCKKKRSQFGSQETHAPRCQSELRPCVALRCLAKKSSWRQSFIGVCSRFSCERAG